MSKNIKLSRLNLKLTTALLIFLFITALHLNGQTKIIELENLQKNITVPVFITSAKNDEGNWKSIFYNIKSISKQVFFLNLKEIMIKEPYGLNLKIVLNTGRQYKYF